MSHTLLVLAAGMGSRFGGVKQIEPVGPHGEIIIDYSIHDALAAGFRRAVFVIRREIEDDFRRHVGNRFEDRLDVDYVYQNLESCVPPEICPAERTKPWGTGHAILVGAEAIDTSFAVINADDYYGAHAFSAIGQYLETASDTPGMADYAMVGYVLSNTLSENGVVSRGVCTIDSEGFLRKVVEHTKIAREADGVHCLDGEDRPAMLTGNEIVSMNLWGFTPSVFAHLRERFHRFLQERGGDPKAEFYIPTVIDQLVAEGRARVRVLESPDNWFGVTYREDKAAVQTAIRGLIDRGVYPEKLW
jgi:UTP-glucose-1-phosphate uridylyltransferase